MSGLYGANTPERFWSWGPSIPPQDWQAAARRVAGLVPDGESVFARAGWNGLMDHILGEQQFGTNHHCLSSSRQLYYRMRPILPRQLGILGRRLYRATQEASSKLNWPVEDRYVQFMFQLREIALQGELTCNRTCRSGVGLGFWPNDAQFAFVITHDVERADGQAFVRALADLDERYGFRSAFNFVPDDYPVDEDLLAELVQRGFEVGVHGLKHDGKLFSSRNEFERAATRINGFLRRWSSVGFRSPFTHRNPEWLQCLDIEYDSSFFDTDPYEPMPGGTMSIWPFFCGRFVELPYTLAQDHTLLVTMRQRTPKIWLDKVEFIARWGGMALVNVHPDYMHRPELLAIYEDFLRHMAQKTRSMGKRSEWAFSGRCWHALPCEVERWWRIRADQPDGPSEAGAVSRAGSAPEPAKGQSSR